MEQKESLMQRVEQASTDAFLAVPEKSEGKPDQYRGASLLVISPEEQAKLLSPTKAEDFEIHPQGFIYLPQVFVREKLNQTFGIGQWALLQIGVKVIDKTMCYDGMLFIRGCYVARAVGEADYLESNSMSSWASTNESAKSDCLTRCCKDLGIAREAWQPQFTELWKKQFAKPVYRTGIRKGGGGYHWRRKNAPPFDDESIFTELYNKASMLKNDVKLVSWWEECKTNYDEFSTKERTLLHSKYTELQTQFGVKINGESIRPSNIPAEGKAETGLFTDDGATKG